MLNDNLKKSICFVGIGLLLAFSLNSLLIYGLRHYQGGAGFDVWNQIIDGKAGADILISGSSRALIDFDCQAISQVTKMSCYNIGFDGQRYNLIRPLLETYLKHNRKPKIVVLTVGITDLSVDDIFRPYQFIPYLNENELYKVVVKKMPEFRYDKYVPLYAFTIYKKDLLTRALKGLRSTDTKSCVRSCVRTNQETEWADVPRINGFLPVDRQWSNEFEAFKSKFPKGKEYKIAPSLVDDLEAIIQRFQQENIKVLLVFPPVYYESIEGYTKNLNEIFQTYKAIAERNHIQLMDYSKDPMSKDTKYFYNSQHMNKKGAAYFSSIFAESIILLKPGNN